MGFSPLISLGKIGDLAVPPAGFEPAHPAPEAGAAYRPPIRYETPGQRLAHSL